MGDQKIDIPGRYVQKQEEPLGQGGMGIVYLVYSVREMRDVALKLMTGYYSDAQKAQKALEKFRQEADIAKNVRHPHVLPAIDSGETRINGRDTPYLVFEYLPDGSLQDLIAKKKEAPWKDWELLQIADIIIQAADALQYLHDQKPPIAHRDVKPGNFLIRTTAREKDHGSIYHLYLCDYGIARRQKTLDELTSDPRGTPLYMAPEQFKGQISYLSDQYSLAIMACYLLTGKLPIEAPDGAIALAHEQKEPIPPSALNPERIKSGEIDEVILKALAKVPNGRYPTISAFASNLRTAIEHQESPSSTQRLSRLPSISLEPLKPYEDEADEADATLPVNSQPQLQLSTTGTQVTLPSLNLQRVLSRQLPARPTMLTWSWDGKYILCLFNNHSPMLFDCNNNQWNLSSLGLSHAACWTPDRYVTILSTKHSDGDEKQNMLCVCNLGEIVNLKGNSPSLPEISRDASSFDAFDVSCHRLLAVWVEDRIAIYQLPLWSPSMQLPPPSTFQIKEMYSDSIGVLRWSPDGSMLAMGARNGAVLCLRLDRQSARLYKRWDEPACQQRVCSLAWSPDSKVLAVAFSSGRVLVLNALERRKQAEWRNLSVRPHSISISNSQQLTVASSESYLLFGDLDEDSPSAIYPGFWCAAWSPTHPHFATLDPANKKDLIIWGE